MKFKAEDLSDNVFECRFFSDINRVWEADDDVIQVASGSIHTGTAVDLPDGVYHWNVECNDGENIVFAPSNRTFKVDENDAPVLEEINDINVNEGDIVRIIAVANDPDTNDVLIYSINDSRFTKNNNVFTWQTGFNDAGAYKFKIGVSDGRLIDEQEVNVVVNNINREPKFNNLITLQRTNEDVPFTIRLSDYFSDPDNDALIYNVVDGGEHLTISINESVVTIIPDKDFWVNTKIRFGASDTINSVNSNFVDVIVNPVNDAPLINDITNITVNENEVVEIIPRATDVDGDTLTFTINDNRFTKVGDLFRWLPEFNDSGEYNIVITVSDGNLTDSTSFKVIVRNSNRAPVVNNIGNQITDEDSILELNLGLYFSDPDNDALIYNYEGGNNLDIRFNSNTAVITPKKDFNGESALRIVASDGKDDVRSNEFEVFVNPVNDAPVLEEINDINVNEGSFVEIRPKAIDVDNDTISYSINDARFNKEGDVFKWQTGFNDAGTYIINVKATDGILEDDISVKVIVNSFNIPPKFNEILTNKLIEDGGIQEAGNLNASDEDGVIDRFEVVNGIGLDCSIKEEVKLFANPNKDFFGKGKCIVRVFDNENGFSDKTIEINVENVQDKPEIIQIFPDRKIIEINTNKIQNFFVNAKDVDNENLQYEWKLDGMVVSNFNTYTFSAGNSEMMHTLIVKVADGKDSDENEWTINVTEMIIENPLKTCQELNGFVCSNNQVCNGILLDASDTNLCCSISCSDIVRPPANNSHKNLTNLDRCENGEVGKLEVEIKEPDNGDEFSPLDEIEIEVNVENNNDKDKDIEVEAILYDLDEDEKVEKVKSEEIEIDEDEEEDVSLVLKIPNGEIDEDHDYILFVKAFEEGDEDKQCSEDEIDVDIEKKTNDVRIDKFLVEPEILTCNSRILNITAEVINVGSEEEEDIVIEVSIPNLKLREESGFFTLEDRDEDEVSVTKTIKLRIPDDAEKGQYEVIGKVFYDDNSKEATKVRTITIGECKEEKIMPSAAFVNFDNNEKMPGERLEFTIVLKNNEDKFKEFTIAISDNGLIEGNSINVLIPGDSEKEVIMGAQIKDNTEEGEYKAEINIFEKKNLIKKQDFLVKISKKESIKWPINLYIVDFLLLLILVYFIKILVTNRNIVKEKLPPVL